MSSDTLPGLDDHREHCETCVGLGTVPECEVRICKMTAYCIHGHNTECDDCGGRGFINGGIR